MEVQEKQPALPVRAHTILGVCEGVGEDFGFNPVFLRIPFAASVIISPTWAIGTYLALGLVVLASRLIFPRKSAAAADAAVETEVKAAAEPAANEQRELATAA